MSTEQTAPCRFCRAPLTRTFVDLGMSPLCQSHLEPADLNKGEEFYPLHVFLCENCMLVQLQAYVSPEKIFTEYAYFSAFSDTMLKHAESYVEAITPRLGLGPESQVVEIASNDGYLLQYFMKKGIKVLGVEPAANVAKAAEARGVPTVVRFFGVSTAQALVKDGVRADLLLGNNVLPHVPDLHDLVGGIKILLKDTGVATIEFQHLMTMMQGNQFDTIYQEHFSYLTLSVVKKLFEHHGLTLFDVEKTPMHGGSLRIFAAHAAQKREPSERLAEMLAIEEREGMNRIEHYANYGERVKESKRQLLEFLIGAKRRGETIVGYGAAGKTNTLFNYCGIRSDFLDYVVDRNPYKQGKFLPGTHIPIYAPERIRETRPNSSSRPRTSVNGAANG
jgi:2-polyprenyl-3-methyl-5-hydroxy-6-metoxy-1,4-benzoquinol methylase